MTQNACTQPTDRPWLVAVVVTYNRLAQLQQTLARLLDSPPAHLDAVLVLDNASTDGTGPWLQAQDDPRLHVITSPENLGGAGGFETAMRATTDRFDPDWMVLMDDDGRPAPDTLAQFHAHPRDDHHGWAAPVYYPDGRICDMNRPWLNPFKSLPAFLRTLLRGREGFHLGSDAYASDAVRNIDGGSFVGLFLSRAAVQMAGYPDGRLFLYGDDVLYTLTLGQAGGTIGFDPNLPYEHDCDTLTGGSVPTLTPLWKVYYYHRNLVMVYRRVAGPLLIWPVLAIKALSWHRRAHAYGAQADPYRRLLSLALRDGIRHDLSRPRAEILTLAQGG